MDNMDNKVIYKISYNEDGNNGSTVNIETSDYNEFLERLRSLAGINTPIKVSKEVQHTDAISGTEGIHRDEKTDLYAGDVDTLIDMMRKTKIFEPETKELALRAGILNYQDTEEKECDCPDCQAGKPCPCEQEHEICPHCLAGNCPYHEKEEFKPLSFNPIELLNDRMNTMINPALYDWLTEKAKILDNISMERWDTALEDFTRELINKYGYDRKEAEEIIVYLVQNYKALTESFIENFTNMTGITGKTAFAHYVGDEDKRFEKDLYNRYIQAKHGDNPLENKPADENDIWARYETFLKNNTK